MTKDLFEWFANNGVCTVIEDFIHDCIYVGMDGQDIWECVLNCGKSQVLKDAGRDKWFWSFGNITQMLMCLGFDAKTIKKLYYEMIDIRIDNLSADVLEVHRQYVKIVRKHVSYPMIVDAFKGAGVDLPVWIRQYRKDHFE